MISRTRSPRSSRSVAMTSSAPRARSSSACSARRTTLIVRKPRARASCSTTRPSVEPAAFCSSHSPGWTSSSSTTRTHAVSGLTTSCAAAVVGDAVGHRHQAGRGHHHALGPRPRAGAQGHHPLPDGHGVDPRAERLDLAHALQPGRRGQRRELAVPAAQHREVGGVDGPRPHAQEHLALPRLRARDRLGGEDVDGLAELGEPHGAHGRAARGHPPSAWLELDEPLGVVAPLHLHEARQDLGREARWPSRPAPR